MFSDERSFFLEKLKSFSFDKELLRFMFWTYH
jgi:hypothetical protein